MTDVPRTHAVIDEYGDVVAWVATEAEAVAMLKEPYCGFKMRQPHCPFRLEDYGTPVYERSIAYLAETIRARRNPKPPARGDAPKVRRNAPCPCGSGRKYKRCCGGVK